MGGRGSYEKAEGVRGHLTRTDAREVEGVMRRGKEVEDGGQGGMAGR